MAGHDFVDQAFVAKSKFVQEDWGTCPDGKIEPRAVKGAVEDFAAAHGLKIRVTQEGFPTWLVQK